MPRFVLLRLGQTLDEPLERVLNRDAMANPQCLDWYVAYAAERSKSAGTMAA
jgi:acetoacetyl-CoA synthetase